MNLPNDLDDGYYDDEGFEVWCENNKDDILEKFQLNLAETEDIDVDKITYSQVPQDFKEELFEEYLEFGGDE